MNPATKADWKNEPLPADHIKLPLQRTFTQSEFEMLKRGLVPQQMEDKWFIYYLNDALHFHRSWTGHAIYVVPLTKIADGYSADVFKANRDPDQYKMADDDFDTKFLNFLIDALLLNKKIPFPTKTDVEPDKMSIFRHSMIGNGRSNQE